MSCDWRAKGGLRDQLIEFGSLVFYDLAVLQCPIGKTLRDRKKTHSQIGDGVFHPRWDFRVHFTLHKAVSFEGLECVGQHFLGHPRYLSLQCCEPNVGRVLGKKNKNQQAPFRADRAEEFLEAGDVMAFACHRSHLSRYLEVTPSHCC